MKQSNSSVLSIELLPEFGWTINGTSVYGPGSVFQGDIKVQLRRSMQPKRISVVFHGLERIQPFEVSPGVLRSRQSKLFGTQQTLWSAEESDLKLQYGTPYHLTFTIQMPMVQYPPSMEHELYKCSYTLSAVLELSEGSECAAIKAHKPIMYMPFIETQLLKAPLRTEAKLQQRSLNMAATVKIHSLHYVPGETLSMTVFIEGASASKVTARLVQSVNVLVLEDVPCLDKTVAVATVKLSPLDTSTVIDLALAEDLTPSFSYSAFVSVQYQLRVRVQRKGPLGGIWSSELEVNLPITIGTLGYGIRVSDELDIYTTISSLSSQNRLCVPHFVRVPEYEDALPPYDAHKLPPYCNDANETSSSAGWGPTPLIV